MIIIGLVVCSANQNVVKVKGVMVYDMDCIKINQNVLLVFKIVIDKYYGNLLRIVFIFKYCGTYIQTNGLLKFQNVMHQFVMVFIQLRQFWTENSAEQSMTKHKYEMDDTKK